MTKTEAQIVSLKEAIVDNGATIRALLDEVEKVSELKAVKEQLQARTIDFHLLKQGLSDQQKQSENQQKHIDKWDSRIWAFIGAIIALLSGLVVTPAGLRKTP